MLKGVIYNCQGQDMAKHSPGQRFRAALTKEFPLQIVGTINAYSALQADHAGFRALYLSGAGVANASLGLPDLDIMSVNDVCVDVRRITQAVDLPLLVDADTGWGNTFALARGVQMIEQAGACGVHIEDQVYPKRCGHRPGKVIVDAQIMVDRIKSAVDARGDDQFVIMARTDALASEGIESAMARAQLYVEAGADMLFPEALTTLEQYAAFNKALYNKTPLLANITEFGRTPPFSTEQLRSVGVHMALYPLSAFRAMSKAAQRVYTTLRKEGSAQACVADMQTREELYAMLNYYAYEQVVDAGHQAFVGNDNGEQQ